MAFGKVKVGLFPVRSVVKYNGPFLIGVSLRMAVCISLSRLVCLIWSFYVKQQVEGSAAEALAKMPTASFISELAAR